MQTSEQIDKISPALVKAQGELSHAIKDATNPHFKTKYADLGAVWDAAKPVLKANKLAALQDVVSADGALGVRTRLLHESGQWIEFDPPMIRLDKPNAQGAGSALTYGRRYSLSAALGVVADEDDDGNAASNGNGSGVADAHSNTNIPDDYTKAKNAPGISEAKTWVREHLRDLESSEDGADFIAKLVVATTRWTKICGVYPNLWSGPDGSGLRGEALKYATIFQCRAEFDKFVKQIEAAAVELQQPKQAAQ
jgi:hypothetical protein